MVLEKLVLNNFRAFQKLEVNLKPNLNLIIGANASGKTTLLLAASRVLSSFFVGFSDENTRFTGLHKSDFTIRQNEFTVFKDEPISIQFTWGSLHSQLILTTKKTTTQKGGLMDLNDYSNRLLNGLTAERKLENALPLIRFYSAREKYNNSKTSFGRFPQRPSLGYYEALSGFDFINSWTHRLLILKENPSKGAQEELKIVTESLMRCLGLDGCNVFKSMDIRINAKKVFYTFQDDRVFDTENLPDGLMRILSIFLDLTFRCVLLNGAIYGFESTKRTTGTVLIDEVDLHLHPSLQVDFIKGLSQGFPNVQFILTSHAPMVMSAVPNDDTNQTLILKYKGNNEYDLSPAITYGQDASTILEGTLNIDKRLPEVEKRLTALFDCIDEEKYQEAKELLVELRKEFSINLPELTQAETMISLLSDDQD